MSIFEEKTYYTIWYADLEKFVKEVYGVEWKMLRSGGYDYHNDTYVIVEVSAEGPDFYSDEEIERDLQAWLSPDDHKNYHSGADIILWDLYRKGLVQAGEYLISISW